MREKEPYGFVVFGSETFNGKDTEFGRKDSLFRPLTAPYYISTRGYPGAYKTEGGLEVNERLQVLRAKDDKPIGGLYAAGSTCGSITARINDAVSSGLLAGQEAADSVK